MLNENKYIQFADNGNLILPNIKQIFLPDEGKEIADVDLCLTEDHEVLTLQGWVNLRYLVENRLEVEVACWNPGTQGIEWKLPKDYICKPYNGKLHHIEGKVSLVGTNRHKQPMSSHYKVITTKYFKDIAEQKLTNQNYIHSGISTSNIQEDINYLRYLVALQADGCYMNLGTPYTRFSFTKERKKVRLREILSSLNAQWREREEGRYTHFYLDSHNDLAKRSLKDLGVGKIFPKWLLNLAFNCIYSFVEELQYWDGKPQKLDNFSYFSNTKENIDLVQALCSLCGKYSAVYKQDNCYDLYISNKITSSNQANSTKKVSKDYNGFVYCITTHTNFFVCRRNNKVCITGNSGADIMVVAADSNCKWLLDFFSKPQKKKVYAQIASEYFQRDISDKSDEYKLYKAVFHGCVTGDHQVLTRHGWKDIKDLGDFTEIAVWNKDTSAIHFELPKSINRDFVDKEEELFSIEGSSISFLGTQDHRHPVIDKNKKTKPVLVRQSNQLYKSDIIPYTGDYIGGETNIIPDMVRLIVALQADGTIAHIPEKGETTFAWRFTKKRKIERLEGILNSLEIPFRKDYYPEENKRTREIKHVYRLSIKGFLQAKDKYLDWSILDWNKESLQIYVDELQYWDGHIRSSNGVRTSITSTDRQAAEIMQTLFHITGNGSKIITKLRDKTRKTLYEISTNNRKYAALMSCKMGKVSHIGTKVYCPQTSTGFFLVKREGNIYVTGNTNYKLGIKKLAMMAGISITEAQGLQDFYFRLNPEVKAWHLMLEKQVKQYGYVTNIFGRRMEFLDLRNPNLMNEVCASIPQCVPIDCEVLTKEGWKKIKDISDKESIAIWDKDRNITFEVPSKWNYGKTNKLYKLDYLGYSCTENHRLPFYNPSKVLVDKLYVTTAKDKPVKAQIPRYGRYLGGDLEVSKYLITLITAFQADGTYRDKYDRCEFHFTKNRKIERLEKALINLYIPYTKTVSVVNFNSEGHPSTYFYINNLSKIFPKDYKVFGSWLLSWTRASLEFFINELQYWDGSLTKCNQLIYSSIDKKNCEWVMTIGSLLERRSYLLKSIKKKKSTHNILHRTVVNYTKHQSKNSKTKSILETLDREVDVACPTVSTGFFLIKSNDKISVTGNSTIGDVINQAWIQIDENIPEVDVLMQTHDSLTAQYPLDNAVFFRKKLLENMIVDIPYDPILHISSDLKWSSISYGDCKNTGIDICP